MKMDDGQKQTINHIYHTLRDMLTHNPALWITNTTPDIKHMIWYLETNFPKDMLEHEMGDRGLLIDKDKDETTRWPSC